MAKPEQKPTQTTSAAMHSSEAVRLMRSRPAASQPVVTNAMLKLDRGTKRRVLVAGSIVTVVLVYVVATAYSMGIFGQPAAAPIAPSAATTQQLTTRGFLEMMVYADGWDEATSSQPVLSVRKKDGTPVLFHAIRANVREIVELEAGVYVVDFVPPVNAGGMLYRSQGPQTVTIAIGHTTNIAATMDGVPADAAVRDDYLAIIAAFDEALALGDATLAGEAGQALRAVLVANAESSPTYAEPVPEPEPAPDYGYAYEDYDYSWVPQDDDADDEESESSSSEDDSSSTSDGEQQEGAEGQGQGDAADGGEDGGASSDASESSSSSAGDSEDASADEGAGGEGNAA